MPPRDTAAPTPTGTARIRGVVTAADTGLPLRQVFVRIGGAELHEGRAARTDDEGRYELPDLPAGRFTVMVAKPGYVNHQYGQRTSMDVGRPLEVKDGETVQANFSLARGGVIAGRVLDELGEPVAEAMVNAMRFTNIRGRRQLVAAGRPDQTNDLGQYRIWGLAPGEYYVSAAYRGMGMDIGMGMGLARGVANDSGYASTFFPGTPSPTEAQPVVVTVGGEALADFSLVPAKVSRITGRLFDSTGKPVTNGQVRVVPAGDSGSADGRMFFMAGGMGRVDEDGGFTISGVAPGSYMLMGMKRDFRAADDPRAEMAELPVTVAGEDVTGVVLTTRPGGAATGQIVFEGGAPPTLVASKLMVFVRPADPTDSSRGAFGFSGRPSPVKDDWSFEVRDLFGRVSLDISGLPTGYGVKSLSLGENEVGDTGFEVRPGRRATSLQVLVSNRFAEVSGLVTTARGEPETDSVVLVFAEDASRWNAPSGRYIRIARPDQTGRYNAAGLMPGDYLVVAVESLEPGTWDPETLERLRPIAKSLRLGDAEKAVMNLKVEDKQ